MDWVEQAVLGTEVVDGVTGAIIEGVAVQAPVQRQSEPSVTLFAADAARMDGFSPIYGTGGEKVSLDALRDGEVYLNRKAADELRVSVGDRLVVYAGAAREPARVRDVVRFEGAGTADAAMLMPLAAAQQLLGRPGKVQVVLVSNRGGPLAGAVHSDDVARILQPVADQLGLEVQTLKQDAIEDAEESGAAFISFFTTFGTFSIVAGILLIFLIFVMLAAERRGSSASPARSARVAGT